MPAELPQNWEKQIPHLEGKNKTNKKNIGTQGKGIATPQETESDLLVLGRLL